VGGGALVHPSHLVSPALGTRERKRQFCPPWLCCAGLQTVKQGPGGSWGLLTSCPSLCYLPLHVQPQGALSTARFLL
jgi:hypothetical protein